MKNRITTALFAAGVGVAALAFGATRPASVDAQVPSPVPSIVPTPSGSPMAQRAVAAQPVPSGSPSAMPMPTASAMP